MGLEMELLPPEFLQVHSVTGNSCNFMTNLKVPFGSSHSDCHYVIALRSKLYESF